MFIIILSNIDKGLAIIIFFITQLGKYCLVILLSSKMKASIKKITYFSILKKTS